MDADRWTGMLSLHLLLPRCCAYDSEACASAMPSANHLNMEDWSSLDSIAPSRVIHVGDKNPKLFAIHSQRVKASTTLCSLASIPDLEVEARGFDVSISSQRSKPSTSLVIGSHRNSDNND